MATLFETLLLATEHTEFDRGAERVAFDLARRSGRHLDVVVPVIRNLEYEVGTPDLAERQARETAHKVRQLQAAAAREGAALRPVVKPCESLHRGILEHAATQGADLIVVRCRGRQGFLSNLMVGEMVSKVATESPCSMLLVPAGAPPWTRTALLALDPARPCPGLLEAAFEMAALGALPLTLLAVVRSGLQGEAETLLRQAAAEAERRGIAANSRVETGDPAERIRATAAATQADLIVVGRHREGRLLKSAFGTTTKKIIGLTDCAVLVFQPVRGDD